MAGPLYSLTLISTVQSLLFIKARVNMVCNHSLEQLKARRGNMSVLLLLTKHACALAQLHKLPQLDVADTNYTNKGGYTNHVTGTPLELGRTLELRLKSF